MATAKWYKVLTELSYPADSASLRNAREGHMDKVTMKKAQVGSIVSDIPADAIEGLLKDGDIEPAKAPKAEEKEG